MSRHYNVVISFNFVNQKDRREFIERFGGNGGTILYTGIHEGSVDQKVITQTHIGE